MRDGFVFRSIPLFTGSLTFLPACNGDGDIATSNDDTTSATSESTDPSTDDSGPTDPTVTSVDTSTGDEPTDTGDPLCGDAGTCGAMAPTGWFGPLVYARVEAGATPPSCPAEVGNPGPTVVDGFVDPGPALCECDCSPSKPLSCGGALIEQGGGGNDTGYDTGYAFIIDEDGDDDDGIGYGSSVGSYGGGTVGYGSSGDYYGGTTFYGEAESGYYGTGGGGYCGGSYNEVGETCTNITINGPVRFNAYEYYGYYGGGNAFCEKMDSEVLPPFSWAASIATCRIPETAPLCDDGVCLPAIPEGFESKWCIYQQGDLDCPAGFETKSTFWSDVEDTRGCSTCDCGEIANCEEAELLIYEQEDCAGEPTVVLTDSSECTEIVGASMIADFGADECGVEDPPVAEGTIEPTGQFTFCCDG